MTGPGRDPNAEAVLRARLERLEQYIAADSLNARLLSDAFDAAMTLGDYAAAQRIVVRATDLCDAQAEQRPYWVFRQASIHLATHADEDARQLLEALHAQGEDDPAITVNLAQLAFRRGAVGEALALLEPLADDDRLPDEGAALLLRGLHRQARLDDALRWIAAVSTHRALSPAIAGIASLIALDADRASDAKAWSERALHAEGAQLEALVARASVALAEDDAVLARGLLERALAFNPQDGRTWSTLAFVEMLEMRLDAAHAHFLRSLQSMPEHIGTWHGLAWCCLLERDLPAARGAFEAALELDRTFAETHGGLAVVAALEGRAHIASELIERARRLDAQGFAARYAQAILEGRVGDARSVVAFARRLLRSRSGGVAQRLAGRIGAQRDGA